MCCCKKVNNTFATVLFRFGSFRFVSFCVVLCCFVSRFAEVMDGDMRRALAAGLADVGEDSDENEDNLLDDDFVVQAAGADDVRGRRKGKRGLGKGGG